MIHVQGMWDQKAWDQANRFVNSQDDWDLTMRKMLSKELAESSEEYFKPLLNVRPQRTNKTRDSIRHEIDQNGTGFEIEYHGLLSALYMDQGNFAPSEVLRAADKGLKAFPVDQRFGVGFPAKQIHGMGYRTPGAPTHWSEETVRWLADDGVAMEKAFESMMEFINSVVIE